MTLDRDRLERLASEVPPREQGVRGLLRSLHRTPPLREWVTIESVALPPVPARSGERWTLTSLLAVPHQPAWGAVRWSWPDGRVLSMTDLRDARHAGDWTADAAPDALDELLARLDGGLDHERFDPAELAPLYARVLPPPALAVYATLVPDARAWLSPHPENEASVSTPPTVQPPTAESVPGDPGLALEGWIADAERFAGEYGLQPVEEQLAALRRRRLLPGFRVAVIGESNRGKSFLVNALLGTDVLPSGARGRALPPVSVVAGQPHIELVLPDGGREERELQAASWHDLGRAAAIRCFVDNAWLRELDVELVDTPAINESVERLTLVQRTLDASDAVLLVVSAATPLSLTERHFLAREVVGRHIARVAVITSRWDTIEPEERAGVLEFVTEEAAAISPQLVVGAIDPDDPDALRSLVVGLAERSDRALWRDRQHAHQLLDAVDALSEASRAGVAAASLDAQQRRAALEDATRETERRKLSWDRTRIELDRRRIALAQALRAQLAATRDAVIAGLMHEAERTPDAAKWWERDLPWALDRELAATARNLDKALVAGLDADLAWLDTKLEAGGHAPRRRSDLDAARQADGPEIENLELRDLDRWRLFTRAGGGLATIAGALLFPPAGLALGITGAVAGEFHLRGAAAEQREQVRSRVAGEVDTAMRAHGDAIHARLEEFYAKLLDDFATKQTAWEQARVRALEAADDRSGPDWQRLAAGADDLRARITAGLQSTDGEQR
jgi:hypothetical protein